MTAGQSHGRRHGCLADDASLAKDLTSIGAIRMSRAIWIGLAAGVVGAAVVIGVVGAVLLQYGGKSPQEMCEGTTHILYDTMIGPAKEAETALIPLTFFTRLNNADLERDPRIQEIRAQLNAVRDGFSQRHGPISDDRRLELQFKATALDEKIRKIMKSLNDADVQEQVRSAQKEPLEITFEGTPRALKFDPNTETAWCAVRWSLNRENDSGIRIALGQSGDARRESIYTVQSDSRGRSLVTLLRSNEE